MVAALASAATFAVGALLPTLLTLITPAPALIFSVATGSLIGLVALGALAARTGGAPIWKGAMRVGVWGALAMAATALVGSLFGVVAA